MVTTLKMFALNRSSLAVGLVFATLSMMFGSWVTRIPDVQAQLGLSEGKLGLALLGLPIGSLLMSPFAAWIMSKLSTGRTMFFAAILTCLLMTIPVAMPSFGLLIVALSLAGLSNSLLNVAMNAAASAIEKEQHIKIMSTCHGFFSFTGMVAALIGGVLGSMGVSPQIHLTIVGFVMIVVLLLIRSTLLEMPNTELGGGTQKFVVPRGGLVGLAFIGFAVMTGEGAIADWSAVYLKNNLGGTAAVAGLGFAGFSLAMALGRFMGDTLIPKWGGRNILQGGSLLGALGLAIAIFLPAIPTAVIGFTLVGIGFSCVVPIVFSEATKVQGFSAGAGIAAVSTTATFGFLAGPPLIGFIAEVANLGVGLGFVMVLALVAAVFSRFSKN